MKRAPQSNNTGKDSTAGKSGRPKRKNSFRETTEAILIALLAAMLLRAFVVQAFRIPTGSMKDTLLVGDFLLVNKFVYGVRTPDHVPVIDAEIPFMRLPAFKKPKHGDVVVFKYPNDPKLDYIKRCIGVGGDTLEVENGNVYINGKPEGEMFDLGKKFDPEDGAYIRRTRIKSPYGKTYVVRHYVDKNVELDDFGPIIIPEGHYFMMGDNRDNSSDSRVWGTLPGENVVGEALVIYFSWDKAAGILNVLDSVRWSRVANLIR